MNSDGTLQTFVVLEISEQTSEATIDWIVERIRAPRNQNGAELIACLVADQHGKVICHLINRYQ